MDKKDKTIIAVSCACAAALFLGGVAVGHWGIKRPADGLVETRTDTTYIERVKTVYRPNPASSLALPSMPAFVFLRDTIYAAGDTIYSGRVDTLIRRQNHYALEDCDIWASGYAVELDSARVRSKETLIRETVVQYVPRDIKPVSIYAKVDGGIRLPNPVVSAGAGLEWRHDRWHIYGEAGYSTAFQGGHGMYVIGGVRLDLLRFGDKSK